MQTGGDSYLGTAGRWIPLLLDLAPVSASLLDENGIVRWQNKASLEVRGLRVGHHFAEFVSPKHRAEAVERFTRLLDNGEPIVSNVGVLTAHGMFELMEARLSVVTTEDSTKMVLLLIMEQRSKARRLVSADRGAGLSVRQREVLTLLAAGRSTDEIARELWLRPTTVRNHIANLFGVLRVHSRLEAVASARRQGLID